MMSANLRVGRIHSSKEGLTVRSYCASTASTSRPRSMTSRRILRGGSIECMIAKLVKAQGHCMSLDAEQDVEQATRGPGVAVHSCQHRQRLRLKPCLNAIAHCLNW